ncbi:MAG TPA: hypothetical protein VF041_04945 [Gemmatimonadaceae bacterium]
MRPLTPLRATPAALALALVVLAGDARAQGQDASDSAAYMALIRTPLAALPMRFDESITGERPARTAFRVRYGLMSFDEHEYTHNFGVGLDVPLRGAVLGFDVGYHWPNCNGVCESNVMASAGVSERLVAISLGRGESGGTVNVGLHAAAGFGAMTDTTLWSGLLSLPVSLVPRGASLRFVPWVAPGVGVGVVRTGSSEAGLQLTFGAGVGMLIGSRVRADVGVNRVFLKDGNWLVGGGFSVGR